MPRPSDTARAQVWHSFTGRCNLTRAPLSGEGCDWTRSNHASATSQPACGKLRQSFRASLATAHQGRDGRKPAFGRRKAAGRRPTKQRQRTRGRASRTAPAGGTAEDPIPAYSSSEYASSSEDEGFEPEPAPRSKRRAATDDERPRKKTKSEHGTDNVYDWPSLKDDVDITEEEARAVEAAERGDSPRNADGAKALPVRDVPPHVFALFARFMAMEREIEVMVEGFPGNVHTSQMRITLSAWAIAKCSGSWPSPSFARAAFGCASSSACTTSTDACPAAAWCSMSVK